MARRSTGIKKREYRDIELNIMPFIDIFSLLNTFLLYSAVFLSVGIIEVQVPFLSNAAPPPSKETRDFAVNVDISNEGKVEVTSSYSQPPAEATNKAFESTPEGLTELHNYLVGIRKAKPATEKVTMFSGNGVTYDKLVKVLDAVKLRRSGDPDIANSASKDIEEKSDSVKENDIYPKVVMGSIMLNGGSE